MRVSRRRVLPGCALAPAAPMPAGRSAASQGPFAGSTADEPVRRNAPAFGPRRREDRFGSLRQGAIRRDSTAAPLQHGSEDEAVLRVRPTSAPLGEDPTRPGSADVADNKRENPPRGRAPAMRGRNPERAGFVPAGGPIGAAGVRALSLSWPHRRTRAAPAARQIGRRPSNGCTGLSDEPVPELAGRAGTGRRGTPT